LPRLRGGGYAYSIGEYTYSRPGIPGSGYTLFGDLRGPRAGLNAGLVRPLSGMPPLPPVQTFSGLGRRLAAGASHRRQGSTSPSLGSAFRIVREEPPMPVKHRLKRRRAEHTARHRTIKVIDAHTLTTHVLINDAFAAGRLLKGRYIALCGQDVLPASLVEPGRGRCSSCVSIPAQRSRP
jgi:hypothetical protein